MPMKTCIDCGMVFPAENSSAKRCCLCVAKHRAKEASVKVYPKPAVDALTRDVRLTDAAGKSYGVWRKDQMLAEQKAREELEAALARNEKHRKKKERQSE